MKTGLVLEGGAMRGMFTAGVLDVLMENGITVDGAIGVSAGAVPPDRPHHPLQHPVLQRQTLRQLQESAAHRQPVQRAILLS